MCLSSQVKRHEANGKQRTLHQLACDLQQVSYVSISSSVREAVPVCDPSSPLPVLLCPILYVALVIIPTVRSGTPSNVFHFLPEPLGGPLEQLPTRKGGFGAASTAFWFCSACSRSAHCSLHLFCPQSGRACACLCVCVCVCVCTRTSARWGNHRLTSCQLRDGLQTILRVCSGWTNKHFRAM